MLYAIYPQVYSGVYSEVYSSIFWGISTVAPHHQDLHPLFFFFLLLLQDLLLLKPVVGVLTCGQQEMRLRLERGEVGHADT